uniref:Uncharacterized protein n=1 Tax=Rhizophora mucronata TaxID=61149 RepID=A0A2P2QNW6_RHIMU
MPFEIRDAVLAMLSCYIHWTGHCVNRNCYNP